MILLVDVKLWEDDITYCTQRTTGWPIFLQIGQRVAYVHKLVHTSFKLFQLSRLLLWLLCVEQPERHTETSRGRRGETHEEGTRGDSLPLRSQTYHRNKLLHVWITCVSVCVNVFACSMRLKLACGPGWIVSTQHSPKKISRIWLARPHQRHRDATAHTHMHTHTCTWVHTQRRACKHAHVKTQLDTQTHKDEHRPQLKASSSSKQSALPNNITKQSHHTT